jgi:hypothetical protein
MNPNIHKPSLNGRIKMLVYGHPGREKTRFAGSSGEMGKTLILRPPTDSTASVAGWPNVFEWVIHDHGELEDAFQEVRGSKEWEWVWFDSISLWQDTGLDDIWEKVLAEKPARARYGLDQGEYGINMFRIGQWVRHMAAQADAGCFNFGITAHPRELSPFEDEAGREMMMPWVQGKNMAPKVCGYMHIVGYIDVTAKGTKVMHTKESNKWYAKDQFHCFPKGYVASPSVKKFVDTIASRGKQQANNRSTPGSVPVRSLKGVRIKTKK